MPTTIAEQVRRRAATSAARPPNELTGAFTREQAEPRRSSLVARLAGEARGETWTATDA
jgi:hypothetical protein